MPANSVARDSIEKIAIDLQIIQNRLNELIWKEQQDSPKLALATLYRAQAQLSQALAEILPMNSG